VTSRATCPAASAFCCLGLCALFAGCYASPGYIGPEKGRGSPVEVGALAGPVTYEAYMVRGIVLAAGVFEKPISGAIVTAAYREAELETETTDINGQFVLRVYHDRGKAEIWIERVTGAAIVSGNTSTTESGVVPRNHAAIPGRGHWKLELTAEAPGYAADSVSVEMPRDVNAPPVELVLEPIDGSARHGHLDVKMIVTPVTSSPPETVTSAQSPGRKS
jgi:hypothetical protein